MQRQTEIEEIQNVKDRIQESAGKLFIEHGYNGVSIRDIANHAETNVAMVNYYFQSKYNLFEIVFEEAFNTLWQKVSAILSSNDDFETLVRKWIYAYYDAMTELPQLPIFILNEVAINPERLTERFKKHEVYSLFVKISTRIKEEEQKGAIKNTPPLDLLLNIISMSIFPFIVRNLAQPIAGVSNEVYDQMIQDHKDYVVNFTLNALRPINELTLKE